MMKTGILSNPFKSLYTGGKWYLRRIQGRPFPLIANLCVSRHCNFKCRFCYVPPPGNTGGMSADLFKDIVRQLADLGAYYLYLSGGEPLLIADIDQWIAFAKQRIPFVHLVTNGFLLDESVARKLERAGVNQVSVSLDGDEGTHDALRQKKGAYRQALQALENLRTHAPSVRRVAAAMATPWNVDQLEHLEGLSRNGNVEIRFTAHVPYPVVAESSFESEWRARSSAESRAKLSRLLTRFQSKQAFAYDPFLPLIPQYYDWILEHKSYVAKIFDRPCHVPLYYLNIMDTGEVFPCPGVTSSLYPGTGKYELAFSMRDQPLREIIHSEAYRDMQEKLRHCRECREYLSSCYVRPRLHFPLGNLLRYRFVPQLRYLSKSGRLRSSFLPDKVG